VIICFGVTSVHGQPLRRSLSTACVTLVCIVVFSVIFLTAYRFIQFGLKLVSYSIFLSHHSGAGGTSCRTLHGVILNHVKGTIMYDIDNLGTDGRLGTLIDAVRVAMNCVVVFGSETLCRPWCIASIVCAHRKGIPLHTVIFTNPKAAETVAACGGDPSGGYVKTFTGKVADKSRSAAFEVDTYSLRGYGLSQSDVHPAIQAIVAVEPAFMNFLDNATLNSNLEEIFGRMSNISFYGSVDQATESLFRSCKRCAVYKDGGSSSEDKTKGIAGTALNIILCDHLDGEAVAVSRLIQSIFTQKGNWLEDQDLSPEDYAQVVRTGKPFNAVFAFTMRSHKSPSQLARLALLVTSNPEIHMVPVAIGLAFDFPDEEFLQKIELGTALNLGSNPRELLEAHAGAPVSFKQLADGLAHLMSFLVCFVNAPTLTKARLDSELLKVLERATGSGRRTSGSGEAGNRPPAVPETA